MTKHIPRKARWQQIGPNEYRSAEGRVFYRAGHWHAALIYRIADAETHTLGDPQTWETTAKLKRPRNAMIVLEDKVTELQRKHPDRVVFVDPR
jgi:hypothetical protein